MTEQTKAKPQVIVFGVAASPPSISACVRQTEIDAHTAAVVILSVSVLWPQTNEKLRKLNLFSARPALFLLRPRVAIHSYATCSSSTECVFHFINQLACVTCTLHTICLGRLKCNIHVAISRWKCAHPCTFTLSHWSYFDIVCLLRVPLI